jgi:hypothetical protein
MISKTVIRRLLLIAGLALFFYLLPSWLEGKPQHGISNQDVAVALNQFPKRFGDWECISDEPLKAEVERTLRCYGYINRIYWNPKNGKQVSLAILYGPRGPMAVHTPEICYSSRGRVPVGKPEEIVPGEKIKGNSFWRLGFKYPQAEAADLDVWYAWSDGNGWIASNYPRFWTAPSLFKIQLAGPTGAPGETNACEDFLVFAVPALKNCLNL